MDFSETVTEGSTAERPRLGLSAVVLAALLALLPAACGPDPAPSAVPDSPAVAQPGS